MDGYVLRHGLFVEPPAKFPETTRRFLLTFQKIQTVTSISVCKKRIFVHFTIRLIVIAFQLTALITHVHQQTDKHHTRQHKRATVRKERQRQPCNRHQPQSH